jgi:15-cis-phytoene synthase
MQSLYAFMRHTDDLADAILQETADAPSAGTQAGAKHRGESLAAWRSTVNRALLGETIAPPSLLPALAHTVRQFQIPHEHLHAVIDGVETDLTPVHFDTFDALEHYCEHVASAVGLACIHIWGFRGPEAFEPARRLGVAMQLTNILRDLKEDAAAGRIYLPSADLLECSYSAKNLAAGVVNRSFLRLMEREIGRAEQYYREGGELYEWLTPDGRRIFGLMTETYHALLRKIASRPEAVLQGRVRLGGIEKLRLFARWLCLPPKRPCAAANG